MESRRLIADRYSVRSVLGRGGMGEVYLARDHRLDTDVALKRVPLELALDDKIREALVREARILARLSDAHIVRLFDLADTPDGIFLVLEYVCGPSLDKVLLKRPTLPLFELQRIMDHVAQALERAHALGIVHRDLKPANLLVSLSGEEQRLYVESGTMPSTLMNADIKVADFGLAKLVESSRAEASGMISGTPAYMAPEQFRGELAGPETDIYSLGLVAYKILAGSIPMGDAQPVYFHMNVTPPPIASVPAHVNAAIQKAILKDRRERFHSAAAFAEALRAPAVMPVIDNKPSPRFRLFAVAAIAVVVLMFVIGIVLVSTSNKQPNQGPAASVRSSVDPAADLPPSMPLNPAARIDVPPPVIEAAKPGMSPVTVPRIIRQPEILAQTRIPGGKFFGFGPDGTLYVTSNTSNIGALRDGKLIWQYNIGSDENRFAIASDGLIWLNEGGGRQRLFCFNAAGQGGEFVDYATKQKFLPRFLAAQATESVRCLDPGSGQSEPAIQQVAGNGKTGWKTALDQPCKGDPVTGSGGQVVVQTESRTIFLLSSKGQVQWTHPAACDFDYLTTLPPGNTAVGLCHDRKRLLGIAGGQQVFSISSKRQLSQPFASDAEGSFYRFADDEIYDIHHLIKTDAQGKDVWTYDVRQPLEPLATMGPDGKIYLLSGSADGGIATILGDSNRR